MTATAPSEPACCPTCNQRLPRPKRVPLREVRTCFCGDTFVVYAANPGQRSCSTSCAAKLRQRERGRPKPEPKPCAWCATPFVPRKAAQECCSLCCRGYHVAARKGQSVEAVRGEVPT